MRRSVNIKLLVGLLIGCLGLGVGLYFLYGVQVRRGADSLLHRADRAEEEGNPARAANYLAQYLNLRPDDSDALTRYGLLLDQQATSTPAQLQALHVLQQAFRRQPERTDVGRRLVQQAVALGQFADARPPLDTLLAALPEDGELEELRARCEEANGKPEQAAEWLTKAVRHAPSHVDNYVRLARLLRLSLEQPKQADKVMDKLVAANGQSFQAYLARGRYRRQFKSLTEAAEDVAQARSLAPQEADVLLAAADIAQARNQTDEARGFLQRGLETYPLDPRMYTALALLEQQAGRDPEALACLRQGLKTVPETQHQGLLLILTDLLIQAGELKEAAEVIARLRREGPASALLDYQEARMLMREQRWSEAVRILERVAPQLDPVPGWGLKVHLLRGLSYEQLGAPDLQLAAYRKATALAPLAARARLGLGSALLALDRVEEAADQFETMMKLRDAPASGWTLLARALLLRNLRLAPGQRDWRKLEQALDRAAETVPESAEVPILRAEMLAAQGQLDRSRQLLEEARDRHPERAEFWIALARWAEHQGEADSADNLLEEARRRLGSLVALQLAQLDQLTRHDGAAARRFLGELEQGLGNSSAADQLRLLEGLAEAHARLGNLRDAQRLWGQLAERQPNNLGIHLTLFDLALQTGNVEALGRVLVKVKAIEGEEGTLWRYGEAARQVVQARGGNKNGLAEARRQLTEVASRRPEWPGVPLLQAEIDELEGDQEQALKNLQRAFELGNRQTPVVQRLVQLLYERQRYADADQVVRKFQSHGSLSSDFGRLAAEVAMAAQDPERALKLARQAVLDGPQDYRNQLLQGLMLWAAGQRLEAERSLRAAVRLAERAPAPRVALVRFLAETNQKEQAEAAIQEAERAVPPEQVALLLAQCYEAVGRLDQAERHYQAALAANADDVPTLRGAASFFLQTNQFPKAEPLLRRLIDGDKAPAADVAQARRQLALGLARGGSYRQFQEAVALIERNLQSGGEKVEDLRAKAMVLAGHSSRQREAIPLLEKVLTHRPTAADRFLLAQLYEARRNWHEARAQLLNLVASEGDNPLYLAHYILGLLRQGEVREARGWLPRLEKVQPEAFATQEIKARLLRAEGKGTEVVTLLEAFLRDKGAEEVGRAAALLDELGQGAAAEKLYRKYVSQSGRPESSLVLVKYLGRQGRLDEALDLWERIWPACTPEAAAPVGVSLVSSGPATAQHRQRVEAHLRDAINSQPQTTVLFLALAGLCNAEERYPEAVALYRQTLDRDSRNGLALNNLAWLLAVAEGRGTEALSLINRAIDEVGPLAELLNTRAVVYLSLGQGSQARADLEEAIAQRPTGSAYFNLARVRRLGKDSAAALDALRKARAEGFKPSDLHPLERSAYDRLHAELERE